MRRSSLILIALVLVAIVIGALVFFLRASPATTTRPPIPTPITPSANADLATTRTPKPPAHPAPDGGARASTFLSAPWGSGAGQLGRRADAESVTVGPMSFLVDKSGTLVLDNVNQRLARFDAHGRPLPPIALPSDAAQDLARGPHGSTAVLDRLRDKDLTLYGSDGRTLLTASLAQPAIGDPGGVTGVFTASDGDLYVEREHGAWLRFIDGDGSLDGKLTPAPGRPTRDGRFVNAAIADRNAGSIRLQVINADGSIAWSESVQLGAPVMFIALLDSDAAGDIFVAAHTGHEATTPPYKINDETLMALALTPAGDELGRLTLPAPPPAEESFRDLYVGDDGTLYWMRRSPAGVEIVAYRLF